MTTTTTKGRALAELSWRLEHALCAIEHPENFETDVVREAARKAFDALAVEHTDLLEACRVAEPLMARALAGTMPQGLRRHAIEALDDMRAVLAKVDGSQS